MLCIWLLKWRELVKVAVSQSFTLQAFHTFDLTSPVPAWSWEHKVPLLSLLVSICTTCRFDGIWTFDLVTKPNCLVMDTSVVFKRPASGCLRLGTSPSPIAGPASCRWGSATHLRCHYGCGWRWSRPLSRTLLLLLIAFEKKVILLSLFHYFYVADLLSVRQKKCNPASCSAERVS